MRKVNNRLGISRHGPVSVEAVDSCTVWWGEKISTSTFFRWRGYRVPTLFTASRPPSRNSHFEANAKRRLFPTWMFFQVKPSAAIVLSAKLWMIPSSSLEYRCTEYAMSLTPADAPLLLCSRVCFLSIWTI